MSDALQESSSLLDREPELGNLQSVSGSAISRDPTFPSTVDEFFRGLITEADESLQSLRQATREKAKVARGYSQLCVRMAFISARVYEKALRLGKPESGQLRATALQNIAKAQESLQSALRAEDELSKIVKIRKPSEEFETL